MSGWMRLWVLISSIWAVTIICITAFAIVDTFKDPEGPWITYNLSDKAKPFFQDLKTDEKGPVYNVELAYTDGTKQIIRFPLLKNEEFGDIDRKIKDFARENGKSISESEVQRFLNVTFKQNSEANSALIEYKQQVENTMAISANERKKIIGVSLLAIGLPPIVLLLIGYGIAWVRKGFA